MVALEMIDSLHTGCVFLTRSIQVQKNARAGEIGTLQQAKAVFGGAVCQES